MNVSFVTPPETYIWILVPFGDTVSQTNVLSFAPNKCRICPNFGGSTDPPSHTPMLASMLRHKRKSSTNRDSVTSCGHLGHVTITNKAL